MPGRVKGFAPWKPQKRTLPLLADIEAVLEEYAEYLPLTVRQVFYRLVAKSYPKTENFYATVQEVCNRARRSGRVDFEDIRDDGVDRQGGEGIFGYYTSPLEYYATHAELYNVYKRSWHAEQPARVAVLCEAAGMVPMLADAVEDYRVAVASSSGFDSLTVKHDLFRDAQRYAEDYGQSTLLLHFGDHDPSGVSVYESMAEDLAAFCEDTGLEGLIEVRRVALTPELIRSEGIATTPDEIKPTDSRSRAFLARGLAPAAQLEAIPPDTLSVLARLAVETALDLDILAASRARERTERAEVQKKLDEVNKVLREAFGLRS